MWDQEKHHLKLFEEHIQNFRARPTALLPFWSAAGYALGMGTALLGKEAAMACTVAVEEVIGEHYDRLVWSCVVHIAEQKFRPCRTLYVGGGTEYLKM